MGKVGSAAIVAAMFLPFPASAQPVSPPAGEWSGQYLCAQGETALHLSLSWSVSGAGAGPGLAVFSFGPLPWNPSVPTGSFRMRGTYDVATRHVTLEPTDWLRRPSGYVSVGLDGRLDCAMAHLTGRAVSDAFCKDFSLTRVSRASGTDGACDALGKPIASRYSRVRPDAASRGSSASVRVIPAELPPLGGISNARHRAREAD